MAVLKSTSDMDSCDRRKLNKRDDMSHFLKSTRDIGIFFNIDMEIAKIVTRDIGIS